MTNYQLPIEKSILIAYQPMRDEVDWRHLNLFKNRTADFIITADKNVDPFDIANELIKKFQDKKVCILIPGRVFDVAGTRHGRGGGWYDRFLSRVPKEWTRMGVAHESQISKELLKREAWDEPMDHILTPSREVL